MVLNLGYILDSPGEKKTLALGVSRPHPQTNELEPLGAWRAFKATQVIPMCMEGSWLSEVGVVFTSIMGRACSCCPEFGIQEDWVGFKKFVFLTSSQVPLLTESAGGRGGILWELLLRNKAFSPQETQFAGGEAR